MRIPHGREMHEVPRRRDEAAVLSEFEPATHGTKVQSYNFQSVPTNLTGFEGFENLEISLTQRQ